MEKILNHLSTEELVKMMFQKSLNAFNAVEKALPKVIELTEIVTNTIENGGRVFYVGAGTSGRIGVLDASEIYPTFHEEDLFNGIIAGGLEALIKAKEDVEDLSNSGEEDLKGAKVTDKDIVIGISASGKTPYVIGALKYAKSIKAKTALVSCKPVEYDFVDVVVIAETGEEFIIGSTRLNAGTAEKLILNMVSTISMVKLGRTYDNLMVAVVPTNKKLIKRASEIVSKITGTSLEKAEEVVSKTKDARIACLMIKKNISFEEALNLLKEKNFNFVEAYES